MDDITKAQSSEKTFRQRFTAFISSGAGSKRLLFVFGFAVIGGVVMAISFAKSPVTTNVTVVGTNVGAVFDGVGAISGGGGNSRYLNDYSPAQQTQILDYLFRPDYGASLQLLKVEIGGDTNSTDGAEASIEHTRGAVNCNAGYEWQLMEQARALNSSIKLYALSWGAPGWIGNGNFWSQDMIHYLISWLGCAKKHNLTINYIGGWNERGYNDAWFENLRTALNGSGFGGVQIVAPDERANGTDIAKDWGIAVDVAGSPTLSKAISVVGAHDICNYPTDGLRCYSTATARGLNQPLWASELGAMDGNAGAPDMVRSINRGYIDAGLTGYLTWPVIDAMPTGLLHESFGLVTADQPWSGNYSVNNMTWAIAHTTQFTAPGWHYIKKANGYLGGNRGNGSYVTYESTNHRDWSMVVETANAATTQKLNVHLSGGLNSSAVSVWASKFGSAKPSDWFRQLGNVTPSNGAFSYSLQPGYVYTFTTTTGQGKGDASSILTASSFPLPYNDTLANLDSSNEATYLATMDGAFEGAPCLGGVSGTCLQQMTTQNPINWRTNSAFPYAVIGDDNMTNYTVSVDALLTQANTTAGVFGRFGGASNIIRAFNGYMFQVATTGSWQILRNNSRAAPTLLAQGTVTPLGTNTWRTLSLTMVGGTISAAVDGTTVGVATDPSYTSGPAGIDTGAFTNAWPEAQFRNLSIAGAAQPVASSNEFGSIIGPVTSGVAGGCLDDFQDSTTDRNKIVIAACNGSQSQGWSVETNNTIEINGKCLDAYRDGTTDSTPVELFTCNGRGSQRWELRGDALISPDSGKCLSDPSSSLTSETQLELGTCSATDITQQWRISF